MVLVSYYYYVSVLHDSVLCSMMGGVVLTWSKAYISVNLCPISYYLDTAIYPAISSPCSSSSSFLTPILKIH